MATAEAPYKEKKLLTVESVILLADVASLTSQLPHTLLLSNSGSTSRQVACVGRAKRCRQPRGAAPLSAQHQARAADAPRLLLPQPGAGAVLHAPTTEAISGTREASAQPAGTVPRETGAVF